MTLTIFCFVLWFLMHPIYLTYKTINSLEAISNSYLFLFLELAECLVHTRYSINCHWIYKSMLALQLEFKEYTNSLSSTVSVRIGYVVLIIKQLLTLSDSAQQSFSLSQAKSSAGPDRYPRWSCSAAGAKLPRELSMKLQGFLWKVKGSWRNQHWILNASAEKWHVTLLPVCWPGLASWRHFKGAKKCYPVHVRKRRRG